MATPSFDDGTPMVLRRRVFGRAVRHGQANGEMPDRCRWPQGRCRCDNGTRANPETGPPFSSPRPKGVEGAVARCAGIPMRSAPVVVDELNEMYALCGVWE
jgi:hypothetical protein